jgi:hypothetical protein
MVITGETLGGRSAVRDRIGALSATLGTVVTALLLTARAARSQAPDDSAAPPVDTAAAAITVVADTAAAAIATVADTAAAAVTAAVDNRFFADERVNILLPVLLFTAFIVYFIRVAGTGKNLFIRSMPGLDAIEEAIGRSTEMGKPILYVPGIDDATNIQTIYSMIILNHVAKRVAQYDTPLIVPVGKAIVVPLAEESVKSGYSAAGRPDAYNANNVRFLSDEQFAFTAAVNGIMNREKPAANIFLGSFFAESLVLAETGITTGAIQIAGTANIHQLPFFVVACDYALVGEEFYAATAYLSREPGLVGTLKATDLMKAVLMVTIIVGVLLEQFEITSFTTWMQPR